MAKPNPRRIRAGDLQVRSLHAHLDRTLAEARALRAEIAEAIERREQSSIERFLQHYAAPDSPDN